MWLSIFLELLVQDTAKVMQNAEKYFFFLCIYCTYIGTHEAVQSTVTNVNEFSQDHQVRVHLATSVSPCTKNTLRMSLAYIKTVSTAKH